MFIRMFEGVFRLVILIFLIMIANGIYPQYNPLFALMGYLVLVLIIMRLVVGIAKDLRKLSRWRKENVEREVKPCTATE